MQRAEYEFIFDRLNSIKDVDLLHKKMGLEKDILYNILGKKIVRDTTKRYYIIKKKSKSLYSQWKRGKAFYEIAESLNFSPIITTMFLLQQRGYSKKKINAFFNDPSKIDNKRIRNEVKEVLEIDFVYSPWAHDIQLKNGKNAEAKIKKWLDKKRVSYITEEESKRVGHHPRTPDFLLRKSVKIRGKKVNWVESKASFGDDKEINRDYKKQLQPYTEHFGPGVVVYWYGFIDDITIDENVMMVDSSLIFKHK